MKNLTLTDEELNKPSDCETKYTFYKKHSDPSMGEVTLLKNTAGSLICYKEQIKNSKEQFAQAIMEARERLKLNHKYLIEMKDYSTKQKNDFCSTFYTIRTFFEYQMNNLQKEIKHRKDGGIDFSMIELTHLLYNISEAGAYLQDRGRAHGDIRPSSIAVMEEGKSYKLIDRADTSVGPLQSQLSYIFSGKEIYLTPQLYAALKKNNMKVNHNEYKSDVFSFGLCILEAGLKRGVGSIYSESNFNVNELQKLIDEFTRKYDDNPLLITTVKKMLSIDEADRPDFKTIMNAIPAYKDIVEFFEGEDQYFEGGDDFTSSRYGDGDYMMQGHDGQMYDPHGAGVHAIAPGMHAADPRYANQYAPQQYGQPASPYHPQTAHVDPHHYNAAPGAHNQSPQYNGFAPQAPAQVSHTPMIQHQPYSATNQAA
jgi:serine/threonine protein kinase